MHYTERDEAIYRLLCAAAEKGEPCPTNAILAAHLGCSDGCASGSICRLERQGRISVRRKSGSPMRVVTITATGATTGDFIPQDNSALLSALEASADEKFAAAIDRCGGRFEDHPKAARRGRTIYAPTRIVQFSDCGISEVYAR